MVYKFIFPLILFCFSLIGCAASLQNTAVSETSPQTSSNTPASANAFNPWMNNSLPNTRAMTQEGQDMLGNMGGKIQSIEGEAAYRKNWRDEIYPVVFGKKDAPGEIMVILDFSNPESEKVWNSVVQASKSLNPNNCKIVVFGRNSEPYGTDLIGLAIWISYSRPGQAMSYLTYALNRWNEVKALQKKNGQTKKFVNEYDATATAKDFPIHYAWFSHLNPPVPANQELAVGKYCFNAGNVNMYQANQICQYYGVKNLPAVIVNGKILHNVSENTILQALN